MATVPVSQRHGTAQKRVVCVLSGTSLATPARARAFVRRHSTGWAVGAAVVSSLELIASELATNAVRHTRSRRVKLRLTLSNGEVTEP